MSVPVSRPPYGVPNGAKVAPHKESTLYRMYGATGELLYVGITLDLAFRFSKHAKEKRWWRQVYEIKLEYLRSRTEAIEAEKRAIQSEKPLYNVAHSTSFDTPSVKALDRKVTREEVERARTPKGGFTRLQLAAWGIPWPPPRGWLEALVDDGLEDESKREPL